MVKSWLVLTIVLAIGGCHKGKLHGPFSIERDAAAAELDADLAVEAVETETSDDASAADSAIDRMSDAGQALSPARASCSDGTELSQPAPSDGPSASIVFPPSRSYTEADTLTVRGSASDPDGVSSVQVNGVTATTSDDFATWTARVPIAYGCNVLQVTTTDKLGHDNANAAVAALRNAGPALTGVVALDIDAQRNRLIAVSWDVDEILGIDLRDGRTTSLVNPTKRMAGFDSLVVDGARGRALIGSRGTDTLEALDLASGALTTLVRQGTDPLVEIKNQKAMALDAAGTTAFVLKRNPGKIIAVDLGTGARRAVAADTLGSGPSLDGALDLVYEGLTTPGVPRLLVSLPSSGQILAVNLENGDRKVLTGAGPALVHPGRMKLDPTRRRLLVVDGEPVPSGRANDPNTRHALIAVDLTTGARETLASPSVGKGSPLAQVFGLGFDAEREVAYLAGQGDGRITRVDLRSGQRELLASSSVGKGEKILTPASLAIAREKLWLVDADRGALVRIDVRTGDRSDVSSSTIGAGPRLESPGLMALEGFTDNPTRALVLGSTAPSLWSVDLTSGNRAIISAADATPSATEPVAGMALDALSKRVVYTETTSLDRTLVGIDLTTGARSVVSGLTRGAGPVLYMGAGVLIDARASERRGLVLSGSTLFAVNMDNGDRSIVSTTEPVTWGTSHGVLDAERGRIVAASSLHPVVEIDLMSGQRRVLVEGHDRKKGPAIRPAFIACALWKQIAYVADVPKRMIVAVDLLSGERAILSR